MLRFKSGLTALLAFVLLFTSVGIIAPGTAGATAATYYQELNLTGNSEGWNGNPAEDISFSISNVTERPGTTAQLLIYAYDIREEDGETARVYWGEDDSALYLGNLAGNANQWSVSVFEVPLDAIQNTNHVYMTVSDTSGGNTWEVEVAWAQLLFDGGPGIDARVDEPEVIYSGAYVGVSWYLQGLNIGSYVSPVHIIDENGHNIRGVVGSQKFYSPGRVPSSLSVTQGTLHTTYFMIGEPYEENMSRIGRVHHIVTIKTSRVAVLDQLAFKDNGQNIALNPSFAPLTRNYSSTVPYSTTEITPVAIPLEGHAVTARINGSAADPYVPVPSSIPLQVGRNTIEYQVTTTSDPLGMIYTITIDRAPALADLSFSSGDDALTPDFSSDVYTYTTVVGHAETPIKLVPTVNDGETIELRVNSNNEADFAPIVPSVQTDDLALITGNNKIEVRVKSPDYDAALSGVPAADKAGLVKIYTVTFAIDETKPSVQFATNGRTTAAQSAASVVTVSDTESGVDAASLQYTWTQSVAPPAGGWDTFYNGDTLSQTSGDGSWYLHIRASDKVGNSIDAVSNPFVLDNTGPAATVSTSAGGMVNAAFPISITYNEDVYGLIDDDLIIVNGSLSNLVSVTSATYTATVTPTTSGQMVAMTVGAGTVTDGLGNLNPESNTLIVQYDTTKPAVTFGSFTDGQRFIVPPAAVTVSVSEAVYWGAGGAELSAANAFPLISMKMDGHAFSEYTPSYDELSRTFTVNFDGTLTDGDYEVLVAGDVVDNGYQNTLDAASASFTVAVPVITGITAAPTDFSNAGGNAAVAIAGINLLGQVVSVYMDGVEIATATVDSATGATAIVALPRNGTYRANSHILTVYLNGVEAAGLSATVTVDQTPEPFEEPQPIEGPQKEVTPPSKEGPGSTHEAGCPFVDLRTHWAHAAVCEAAGLGIVEGVSAQAFMPNRHITRAELAAMLLRTLQTPISQEPSVLPFSDKESIPNWAKSAISTGVSKGMFSGYPDGTFRPQQTINRSEMAVMIAKFMGWQAGSEQYLTYADGASVPGWASASVEAMLVNGLMQGRGGNLFAPLGLTTRAEAAVVMLKLRNTQQQ